ncbi:MAG: CotH kinase family protein [Oscillospiraceae bacterium]|nr:CotH kinase family protein [Oscillospiraceae bacterium]
MTMRKRILSALLSVAMVISVFTFAPTVPNLAITASADENGNYYCGDVLGNGNIGINDALEILKYLAKLNSTISTESKSRIAATGASRGTGIGSFTSISANLENKDVFPGINDALEILKYLAKLTSYYTALHPQNASCDWCGEKSAPVIGDVAMPSAGTGIPFSVTLTASGDGLTWSIDSGNLPAGLSINSSTGVISGTPTADGAFTFTAKATNADGSGTKQFTINVTKVDVTTSEQTPPLNTGTTTTTTVTNEPATTQSEGGSTDESTTTTTTTTATTVSDGDPTTTDTTVSAPTTTDTTTTGTDTTTTGTNTTTTVSTETTTTASTATTTTGTTASTTTTTKDPNTEPVDEGDEKGPKFSHPSGLYLRGFELELTPRNGGEIWYTFSSSTATENVLAGVEWKDVFGHMSIARHEGGVKPTPGAPSIKYDPAKPIEVILPRDRSAFTVSAIEVVDGVASQPNTRSFIRAKEDLAKNWGENDFLVFALYANAKDVFDQKTGIFGAGQDRLDWIDAYAALGGKSREQVIAAMDSHLTQGDYPPTLPANFTRRGKYAEVEVNVEIFDPYRNSRRVNQRAGMRIKGGWSRGTFVNEQKTFEFYARSSYGDRGNFLWPLFGEKHTFFEGNMMHRYERFRVRNGGTDREQTYMRDEMASELAKVSGIESAQDYRPGVVFLNGAYYGMVFLKSPRTNDHWRRQYEARDGGFEMIGSNENGSASCGRVGCGRVIANGEAQGSSLIAGTPRPLECGPATQSKCTNPDCKSSWSSYNSACEKLGYCRGSHRDFKGDVVSSVPVEGSGSWAEVRQLLRGTLSSSLSNENLDNVGTGDSANWKRLNEILDIDQVMHYYAIEIFGGNCDWPSNNVEMWRYYPNDEEKALIAEGKMHSDLDGRWRMIAQDLEYGWGLWQTGDPLPSATHPSDNTLWAVINRPGAVKVSGQLGGRSHFNATTNATYIIAALTKRPDMRAKLANAFSDIMEASHNATFSVGVYEKIRDAIKTEHSAMLAANGSSTRRISELARNGQDKDGPGWPLADSIYGGAQDPGMGTKAIEEFLKARGNTSTGVPSHIQSELGLSWSSRYDVSVTVGDGGEAEMNTRPIGVHGVPSNDPRGQGRGSAVTGKYFTGVEVPIIAVPWAGFVVDSVTASTGTVTPKAGALNTWTVDAAATVNITFKRDPNADPREMVEINSRNKDEYVEIRNNSTSPVSMDGYFLTDDGGTNNSNNLEKWAFPSGITIPAGGTIKVGSRSNEDPEGFAAITNFNMGLGERIRLSNSNGEVVQMVEVSRTSREQTQVRGIDGKWRLVGSKLDFVPPHAGGNGEDDPDVNCITEWSETKVKITVEEDDFWSTSGPVDVWPPTGGPWGGSPGMTVTYNNGMLTISAPGMGGWGAPHTMEVSWGYW